MTKKHLLLANCRTRSLLWGVNVLILFNPSAPISAENLTVNKLNRRFLTKPCNLREALGKSIHPRISFLGPFRYKNEYFDWNLTKNTIMWLNFQKWQLRKFRESRNLIIFLENSKCLICKSVILDAWFLWILAKMWSVFSQYLPLRARILSWFSS